MNEIDKLRAQVAKIMTELPAPKATSFDRDILFYEDELRQSGLVIEVECDLLQLGPDLGEHVFNQQHGFKGSDYLIVFENGSLSVSNKKSGAKKRLLDCPVEMKEKIAPLLEAFSTKIFQQIGDNLE